MYGIDKMTVTEDVSLLMFGKIPADIGLIADIFTTFGESGINIDMICQAAPKGEMTSVSFTVGSEQLVQVLELVNTFRESHPTIKPLISNGNVKIQLYGEQMPETPGVAARVFTALARAGAELMLTTTSEVDISLLLPHAHFDGALAVLQEEFQIQS